MKKNLETRIPFFFLKSHSTRFKKIWYIASHGDRTYIFILAVSFITSGSLWQDYNKLFLLLYKVDVNFRDIILLRPDKSLALPRRGLHLKKLSLNFWHIYHTLKVQYAHYFQHSSLFTTDNYIFCSPTQKIFMPHVVFLIYTNREYSIPRKRSLYVH